MACCPIGALLSGMCKHRQCQTFTQRCPMTSGPSDKGLDQNRWVEKLDVGQAQDTEKRFLPLLLYLSLIMNYVSNLSEASSLESLA